MRMDRAKMVCRLGPAARRSPVMPVVPEPRERDYIARRLGPILKQLRSDPELCEQFFIYAREHGANSILTGARLQRAFRPKTSGNINPFFALILADFEASLTKPSAPAAPVRVAKK